VSVVGRESMRARFAGELTVTDYLDHKAVVNGIRFFAEGDISETHYDYIWLTVKCTGLEQALMDLAPYVSKGSVILSCQNGLGSDAQVQVAFPNNTVRRVIMTSNVAQPSDLHLHRGSQGDLFVEAHPIEASGNLAELVSSPLLIAQSIEDMDAYSWAKLQLNLANAVNALANVPVKEMLEHRGYRRIIALAMHELIIVAQAKGLKLPRLWWDLNNQRMTEVDNLNGAVVTEAQAFGIACPVNQNIVETVHRHEQTFEADRPEFSAELFLSECLNAAKA